MSAFTHYTSDELSSSLWGKYRLYITILFVRNKIFFFTKYYEFMTDDILDVCITQSRKGDIT